MYREPLLRFSIMHHSTMCYYSSGGAQSQTLVACNQVKQGYQRCMLG